MSDNKSEGVTARVPGKMYVTAPGMLKIGGAWLGATRTRIQQFFRNGSDVTWGSNDRLSHAPTVHEIETIAASAVAAYINEDAERFRLALKQVEEGGL